MLGPLLTPREQQVLEHIWAGLTLKEIAVELDMGVGTVRGARMELFRKLHAHTLVQAVRRGLELGLLQLEQPAVEGEGYLGPF